MASPLASLSTPESELEKNHFLTLLGRTLASLPPKEEWLLRRRYGLGREPTKLREIADLWGLTPTRVMQIECRALRRLRHPSRKKAVSELLEFFHIIVHKADDKHEWFERKHPSPPPRPKPCRVIRPLPIVNNFGQIIHFSSMDDLVDAGGMAMPVVVLPECLPFAVGDSFLPARCVQLD